MNDFTELEYGYRLIVDMWADETGGRLKELLTALEVDVLEFSKSIKQSLLVVRQHAFLGSVCLHDMQRDNQFGKLSMWRAYGNRNGVALVMNPMIFAADAQRLGTYSMPVRYMDQKE
jgi:hypothetical protein